ncbi:MAG: Helix-turn-helix domain [Pseudomonadota bacterium]|jgi:transcriptional regulator with XRE-family HTH domain
MTPSPPDPASDTQPLSFADTLAAARQALGLTIEDAAKLCLMSANQIQGLETGDYRAFYSLAFAQQAASRYARFLGLPGAVPDIGTTEFGECQSSAPRAVLHPDAAAPTSREALPGRWEKPRFMLRVRPVTLWFAFLGMLIAAFATVVVLWDVAVSLTPGM